MSTRVDAALIRARRLELGLSERKLAAITGLGQAVIRGIEAGVAGDLALRDLDRVADALVMNILDLLATDAPASPPVAGPTTLAEHLDHYVGMVGRCSTTSTGSSRWIRWRSGSRSASRRHTGASTSSTGGHERSASWFTG